MKDKIDIVFLFLSEIKIDEHFQAINLKLEAIEYFVKIETDIVRELCFT